MEHKLPHIILRQVLEFEYSGAKTPLEVQELVHSWCLHQLMPCIEATFNELSDDKSVLRVDKLELNISLNEKDFTEGITGNLHYSVTDAIRSTLASHTKVPLSKTVHELFLHFLERGTLTWNSPIRTTKDLVESWLQVVEELTAIELDQLSTILKASHSQRRLVIALTDESLVRVLAIMGVKNEMYYVKLISLLRQLSELSNGGTFTRQGYDHHLTELVDDVAYNRRTDHSYIVGSIVRNLLENDVLLNDVRRIFDDHQIDLPANSTVVKQERNSIKPDVQGISSEVSFISNAGLILLHPFIPKLFEVTGVIENNNFNSVSLAVALLHFCATAEKEYGELELILPKILCGLHPSEQVDTLQDLPDVFTKEVEEMLQASIKHWDVLKDTSTTGLRETFLKREARLREYPDHWELTVFPGPFDMLLTQLPWSFEFARLPWMSSYIHTRWET